EDEAGGATRLWVAIADVSHYVRPGSALDAEAFRRGTSVYLPDRVLPMLPERLSNGICSLRPDEDRLCLVAEMVFDGGGQRTSTELYPAVMRSAARCTYDEVQRVLDGETVPSRDRFRPLFERLRRLGRTLRKVRERRGAIDFDLPETRPELDEQGRPVRIARRERKESHRIVEDCMLAANEAVAAYFQERGLPSVYRFHDEPDPDKLSAFAELARAHGFTVPGKGEPTSRELNLFMRGLVGHPGQRALNQLLLRSMMQAVYSPDQIGHYGLGAEEYLHFTSPIRRYPDLLVHRLLRAHWERNKRKRPERELERELDELRRMAEHSSERERAAMKCEREVNALYACLLMEDRVGEEFAATVSSLTDFGFFVELDAEHVEGLVRADELGPGHRLVVGALVWPSGRRVQVGQTLTVRLAGVNVQRHQMDFDVVAFTGERPSRRRGGAERAEAPARDGKRPHPPERAERQERPGEARASDRIARGNRPDDRGKRPAAAGQREPARGQQPRRGKQEQRGKPQGPPGQQASPGRPTQQGGALDRDAQRSRQEPQSAASPHPGFDRLRGLAQREGLGKHRAQGGKAPDRRQQPGRKNDRRDGSPGRGQRHGAGGDARGGSSPGRRRRR
ncbi:MAG TPA: VacB/RNase II family 3'-5' exoribonuclease, partial [Myxococcaceae bacterium]